MENYEVLIIGGGPAGLSAAVYAARSGASTCVIDAGVGGAASNTPQIENYPGAGEISGYELVARFKEDATRAGATLLAGEVVKIEDGGKKVVLKSGQEISCRALVLAFGSRPKPLGLPGEENYLGAGLSYCATCDGNFFKGKTVAVVGNNAHAKRDAAYLTGMAEKVFLIGAKATVEGVETIDGRVTALKSMPLQSVTVRFDDGREETLPLDGLFVSMGYEPSGKALYAPLVQTNAQGYIVCDAKMQTSVQGVFAAGDIVDKPLRQVVCAASDGAIAGQFAAVYARHNVEK